MTAPRPPRRFPPRLGIGGRLILLHLSILTALTLLLGGIEVLFLQREVRDDLGRRALNTSRLVAQLPSVVAATGARRSSAPFVAFVNRLRAQVGADYIVVGDKAGVRLAHPRADRIGKAMEGGDNAAPLAGREIVSVATGSLGLSVRGKVPVRDAAGQVVGVVSTGYLMPRVRALAWRVALSLAPWFVLALAFGTLGAILVARRLKREILNLEPEQIATLVQRQDAVLAALREGVLAVEGNGLIEMINPRAARLLGIEPGRLPLPLAAVWPELARARPDAARRNQELTLRGVPVLLNAEPLAGGGFVASLRDRREVLALAEELTQVRGFVDVLRAQTHEHHNRLHTIGGLLQLGRPQEALEVVRDEVGAGRALRELLLDIRVPRVVALLAGKRERAQELGLRFEVDPGSCLSARWEGAAYTLITAVGNLTDNAFEALAGGNGVGRGGTVRVSLGEDPEGVQVEVMDDGPGVPPSLGARLFEPGVSSKGAGRGHGLAGVAARVRAAGGEVRHVRREGWTVFQVSLPASAAPERWPEERA